jgi:tRNA G18 (ribose-2'-O)-methylase SpoU
MPQIIEITDLSRPELDVFCRLTEAQLRNRLEPEKGVFIAESPTVIGLALDAGYEPLALLTERKFIEGKAAGIIARCGEIPLYTGEREVLARLTGYELTRGVLCAMRRPSPKDFREVCAGTRRVAVLENVVDSTNVGAIIRSNRRAVRVSMGTVFQIPWAYIGEQPADWPSPGLDWLNELGFKTAAMALREDSVSIDDEGLAAEPKLAIVLGTEGTGLTARTIADCDYTVRIPMQHGVDSLNVAAASAVAFWQLRAK